MPNIAASGQFPPDGLELDVAFEAGGAFYVSEIWDSPQIVQVDNVISR